MSSPAAADAALAEEVIPDSPHPENPAGADVAVSAEDTFASPVLPADVAAWRALILTIPGKDLLRLITKDKGATARIFAGFRAGPDTIRRAVVVQRMAEAAVKETKFATALGVLIPAASASVEDVSTAENSASDKPLAPMKDAEFSASAETSAPASVFEDPKLREKLKEQRVALRDKDNRIAALEATLAGAQRERDAARQEGEAARAAAKAATEETERIRHKRERDERRDAAQAAADRDKGGGSGGEPPSQRGGGIRRARHPFE